MSEVLKRVALLDHAGSAGGESDVEALSVYSAAALPASESIMAGVRARLGVAPGSLGDPFNGRKVVEVAGVAGSSHTMVVPDIPGIGDDSLSEYEDEEGEPYDGAIIDDQRKVYDLSHVFHDNNVADKLGLSLRFLQHLKRTSLDEPAKAAALLQQTLRGGGYPNYVVHAGRYARGKAHASGRLQSVASQLNVPCASVAADVVDDQLHMHHTDSDGSVAWTVYGPLAQASAVRAVYKLCLAKGLHEPVFAYGMDLQQLDITVWDADTSSVISPSYIQHVGPGGIEPMGYELPDGVPVQTQEFLVGREASILPVTYGYDVIGTAVRVSEKYVLINEHVMNHGSTESSDDHDIGQESNSSETESGVLIDGKEFVQRNAVSKDLWVVELLGATPGWVYREPRKGERVVMMYSVGNTVEYSTISRVQAWDHSMFAVDRVPQARHGMSGAVVVSVSDGAMLGVYSGEALTGCVCSVFSPIHFGSLSDLDSVSGSSNTKAVSTNKLYDKIASRGLSTVIERVLSSMTPIHNGHGFRGVAVKFEAKSYTTVDPDNEQLYKSAENRRFPLIFDRYEARRYVSRLADAAISKAVPAVAFTRQVEHGERVFVLSRDELGSFSSESRRVEHVGASGTVFHVADFGVPDLPFEGGAIVAERDGAVVGQFVTREPRYSSGPSAVLDDGPKWAYCYGVPASVTVGLPRETMEVRSLINAIAEKFSFLNVSTWPSNVLHDVFRGDNVRAPGVLERFAAIGRTAAKAQLYKSVNSVGLPLSEWTGVWEVLNNEERLAGICKDTGVADILVSEDSNAVSAKVAKSTLLNAFMGLVVEYEHSDKLDDVCRVLGLLYDVNTPVLAGFPDQLRTRARSVSPASSLPSVTVKAGSKSQRVSLNASELLVSASPLEIQVADMKSQLDELTRKLAAKD